jgi:two-component system CheB/CheR fusion protein
MAATVVPTDQSKTGGFPPVNILLVDDQPAKLLTYEAMLSELGENLIRANSGNEALEQLLKHDVAVVLIDVCMPGLDGFELASMIRRHPRFQKTAIIHVSAVNLTELDRIKGYESGAFDYVSVPIVPEILRAKVKIFVDLYRKTQQLERLNREMENRVSRQSAQLEASTEQLGRSEARFHFLAETIPSFVWTADPDGSIVYANQRFMRYCGLDVEQHKRDWRDLVLHPDDLARYRESWDEALREGLEYEIEARYRRHDGVYRWFLTRAVPQKDKDDRVAAWFGVTIDVDEQRILADKLRESDRRKDEFLAMLAHELRNPLGAIRSALATIQHPERSDTHARRGHEVIERQTNHLSRLIEDLLDVGRIAHDKIELRREPIQLTEAVNAAIDALRPLVEQAGHALEVALPSEPLPLSADRVRLTQVFLNLLDNAIKFTPRGGRITVAAERSGDEVTVRVADSGSGMPLEALPLIFDMFYQGDRSLERKDGGLGLGLTLARRLVELHGGRIDAASAGSGRGSEFVVSLPLERGRGAAEAPAAAPSRPPAKSRKASKVPCRRVLVADDNQDGAESLALLLRLNGHEAEIAHDGQEAVELAERFRPDVALLDIGMPRLNGYDAARRIRELPWGKDVLLIAATGWAQAEDRKRTEEAGFDAHLVKPVEPKLLLDLVTGRATR